MNLSLKKTCRHHTLYKLHNFYIFQNLVRYVYLLYNQYIICDNAGIVQLPIIKYFIKSFVGSLLYYWPTKASDTLNLIYKQCIYVYINMVNVIEHKRLIISNHDYRAFKFLVHSLCEEHVSDQI